MNILLLRPSYPYPYSKSEYTYNRIWPPLSLANCAALLEQEGHKVMILDAHAQRIAPKRIAGFIKGYDRIFITSSSLDKWQCPNINISPFLETVRYIQKSTEEIYIVGYHGTVEPEKILDLTGAKAAIRGEPEYTVLEICQDNELSGIKSISFKKEGRIISTPQRELLNLRNLPSPSFHLLDFRRYFYEILGRNFALFEISRGCKFRCRFCNKVMYGEGVRTKSKEQIFEEVTLAIEKYNVKTGYFIDLDFLSNRKIVEELCGYLIKKKYDFKWTCQTRPNLLDIAILRKMKTAGCQLIHLGIETGLPEFFNYLNKNVDIDKIKKAIILCKKVDIKTLGFFLFGLPGETEEDKRKSLDFIKEINTDFVSFHKLYPYKGTEIFQDNFEFDAADLDKFMRKALIKYYLRPSYLWRLNPTTILASLRLFYGRIKIL